MTTRIITFEERVTEPRGVHALIAGPYGVGKTSLVRKLNPLSTLFIDAEDGGLAINDVPVPHIRPKTWPSMRDLAVRIAGPNPSFGKNEPYSQEHFDRVGGYLPGIEKVRTVVWDSMTETSRLCFRHSSAQPETLSERTGKPDLRSAYGLHARELLLMSRHLQSASGLNIILTCALETIVDDFGRLMHQLQMEGQRVPREIPGIVDLVITMASIDFGDSKPVRAFVCTSPNPWGYPAKDRSGKLEQIEKPDLGALIAKILSPVAHHQGGVAETKVITPNDGQLS
jgi:AAA domain